MVPVRLVQKPFEESGVKMKAVEWHGNQDIRLNTERNKPRITQDEDAIVRITSTTICGTDLHLYHKAISGLQKGDILGHECVGIVESIGMGVNTVHPGDRVIVSSQVSDEVCGYCQRGETTLCELSNEATEERVRTHEPISGGNRTAGIFGFPLSMNGYQGAQAEYIRVPKANFNLLKIPSDHHQLSEENALILSDILTTSWHGVQLASLKEGDNIAIWGAGPVGVLVAYLAHYLKASKILIVDNVQFRLDFAKKHMPYVEILNFERVNDVVCEVQSIFSESNGPDITIDCVGCHYSKSWIHSIEKSLGFETDSIDTIKEQIISVRKAGKVIVIGYYVGAANHFPIGAFMEKGLTLKAGRVYQQAYWKHLLQLIMNREIDPSFVFTHKIPLDELPKAYKTFDKKEDGMIKVIAFSDVTRL